jgi:hypothetical protein
MGRSPLGGTFSSSGGTLVISVSRSGYAAVAGTSIGMGIKLDGATIPIDSCSIYANPSLTRMAFVPKTFVKTGVGAGAHNITLLPHSPTSTDGTDNYCVTVQELPF